MKKLSLLVMMLVVLLSVFAIEVSAEYYVNEEFTTDLSNVTITGGGVVEIEDGTLHVDSVSTASAVLTISANQMTTPKNTTVLFDYKLGSSTGPNVRPAISIYTGSNRAWISPTLTEIRVITTGYATTYHTNLASTAEKWYSLMIQFKVSGDTVVYDIYRKEKGSDEPYKRYVTDAATWTHDKEASFTMDGIFEANIDNLKIYSGTFAEGTEFELDGTPINSLAEVGSGMLKASTKLVSNQIILDADSKLAPSNVTPILVFYNKNDRMVSCTFVKDSELAFGDNEVEITVDTSSFYNKLEGGYAALYFIDDFDNLQLLADKVEL